jgi:hypothetical protein
MPCLPRSFPPHLLAACTAAGCACASVPPQPPEPEPCPASATSSAFMVGWCLPPAVVCQELRGAHYSTAAIAKLRSRPGRRQRAHAADRPCLAARHLPRGRSRPAAAAVRGWVARLPPTHAGAARTPSSYVSTGGQVAASCSSCAGWRHVSGALRGSSRTLDLFTHHL